MQTMVPQIGSLAAEAFTVDRLILILLKNCEGNLKNKKPISEMFSHIEEYQHQYSLLSFCL